jgi:uncharacterized protein (TIGR00725 family)
MYPDAPSPGPPVFRHPATGVQVRIGVMGSASEEQEAGVRARCRALGRAVAARGVCLLTGACPGLPHEAALGAAEAGGHVVGISPARSLREHVAVFASPYREYDVMIYTGLGLMGRELVNIHSSDAVVVVGGQSGTLGEFAIAFEEGKPIGVLTGTGGIADGVAALASHLTKPTGAVVRYGDDPARLVDDLLACLLTHEHARPPASPV